MADNTKQTENTVPKQRRIAIIGLGKMGVLHAGILNSLPAVRVKAICEKDSRLTELAKKLLPNSVAFYKDHMKMIATEDFDAVFITTPIESHVPMATDVARARPGIGLFVEKPLGSSGVEALEACEVAERSGCIHMVGYQKRFSPIFQHARKLILEQVVGELMFFRAQFFSSDVLHGGKTWRFRKSKGGVILDLAPHLIDLLLWLFGDVDSVHTIKRRLFSNDVEDYVHTAFSFKSGLSGHMDVCWSVQGYRLPELLIEAQGKNGRLSVTDDFIKVEKNEGGDHLSSRTLYKQSFETSVPILIGDPDFTREDEQFLKCLDTRSLPDSNFREAAKVNAIMDKIIEI